MELSVSSLAPDVYFRMDVTASGYTESDYIFIFMDNALQASHALPQGFRTEKTDQGLIAWMLDVSAKTIEDSLVSIGRTLFRASAV